VANIIVPHQRPSLKLKYRNTFIDSLFDSGSQITIFSKQFWQSLCKIYPQASDLLIKHTRLSAVSASNNPLTLMGVVQVQLTACAVTKSHAVYICPQLTRDCLVGIDLINSFQLQYCGKSRSISSAKQTIPDLTTFNEHSSFCSPNRFSVLPLDATTELPEPAADSTQEATDSNWTRQLASQQSSSTQIPISPGHQTDSNSVKLVRPLKLMARSSKIVNVSLNNFSPDIQSILVTVHHPELQPMEALTAAHDRPCQVLVNLINESVLDVHIPRGTVVGFWEFALNPLPVDAVMLSASSALSEAGLSTAPISDAEKRLFIRQKADLSHLDPALRERYVELMYEYSDVISYSSYDLGLCSAVKHRLDFKDDDDCFTKQFPIAHTDLSVIRDTTQEWLKAGVVERTFNSKYNSPIFTVAKKALKGELTRRCVLDYRFINEKTKQGNYRLPLISECLHEVGRVGPSCFSQLDLRTSFQQMGLANEATKDATSYTIPGTGRFRFLRAPYGLTGLPGSFQKLIEIVLSDLPSTLAYIDDILALGSSHDDMLETLTKIFQRLRTHSLKLNLAKCSWGTTQCNFLGHVLTPSGYFPGRDKVAALANLQPPTTTKQVRAFCGGANFFRPSIQHFHHIMAPLYALTRKENAWSGSKPLPAPALAAFRQMQQLLTSAPLLAYPHPDGEYSLYVDASPGILDDSSSGGLGSVLCQAQPDKNGFKVDRIISFASRGLAKHEKHYTPYLAELQAIVWGIEIHHFLLKGTHFRVFSDHAPLTKLSKSQSRTLHRLQLLQNAYSFDLCFIAGPDNPADFLSRSVAQIDAITASSFDPLGLSLEKMLNYQANDPFILILTQFMSKKTLPADKRLAAFVKRIAPDCQFAETGLLQKRVARDGYSDTWCQILPGAFHADILFASHGNIVSGHAGVTKTIDKILTKYWWKGLYSDVAEYIANCDKCQFADKSGQKRNATLQPLPHPDHFGSRIHADLFGPLAASVPEQTGTGKRPTSVPITKKFILVLTDAATKYIELVGLPDKSPETVGRAIFDRYICRYGVMSLLVSDQGSEFVAKIMKDLYDRLQIPKQQTSGYHPQSNSQCEIVNRHVIKYLSTMVDDVLNWEEMLQPMALAWNCGISRATKHSPFFLLYGFEPRLPFFDPTNQDRLSYGDSLADIAAQRLEKARQLAAQNNISYRTKYADKYDEKVISHKFGIGSLVLLHRPELCKQNKKISHHWFGPFVILALESDRLALVQDLATKKTKLVSCQRLKEYRVGMYPDLDARHRQQHNGLVENQGRTRARDNSPVLKSRDIPHDAKKQDDPACYLDIVWGPGPTPRPAIIPKAEPSSPRHSINLSSPSSNSGPPVQRELQDIRPCSSKQISGATNQSLGDNNYLPLAASSPPSTKCPSPSTTQSSTLPSSKQPPSSAFSRIVQRVTPDKSKMRELLHDIAHPQRMALRSRGSVSDQPLPSHPLEYSRRRPAPTFPTTTSRGGGGRDAVPTTPPTASGSPLRRLPSSRGTGGADHAN